MAVHVERRPALGRDLLAAPVIGSFLHWKHARTALQVPLLLLSLLVIADGFIGPQLAPENLAGVLAWVHWRGFLVLGLLVAGNLFCMGCPFMLPRRLAKRLLPANRSWPRRLRSKWLAVALLLVFFWAYEAFSLWSSPWLTAWVAVAYFAAAFVIDGIFQGAAFCKYLCPIGQFNFVNSLSSPLEIRVRQPDTCASCHTKDCIKGHHAAVARLAPSGQHVPPAARPPRSTAASGQPLPLLQNGCELWLFQERKVGNMDCTFCLDCIQACPRDNVGIISRLPMQELWSDPRRSGIGSFSRRPDLAALVLVLVFASFLNAFGMVGPFYPLADQLGLLLHTTSRVVVLLLMFTLGLVAAPLFAVTLAAWGTRLLTRTRESLFAVATRFSYGLAPLGFGMWLAHYSYHFLTGALTVVPVTQAVLAGFGIFLGGREPLWGLAAVLPLATIQIVQVLFVELGLAGSAVTMVAIARQGSGSNRRAIWAVLPWWLLALALCLLGAWLILQPMQMRGTFSVGS